MRKTSWAGLWVMAGVAALMIAGCAKPPVAEQQAAQAAKDAATAIKAEDYAASTWNEALRLWNDAETKMQQKAYTEAKTAYETTQAAFVKAASEVEAGKQAVSDENAKAVKVLEKGWAGLSQAAKRRVKRLQGIAKTTWETDSKIITEALKKAKDVATDPAELKKMLAEANQLAEKWLAAFKK